MHALYFYVLHTRRFLESGMFGFFLNLIWTGILSTRCKSAAEALPHKCLYTLTAISVHCAGSSGADLKNCHGRHYELVMLPHCLSCCFAQPTHPSTGRRKNASSASLQTLQLIVPAFCINQFQWNSIQSFYNRFLQASLLLLDLRLHIHFWELGGAVDETLHWERALSGHLTHT